VAYLPPDEDHAESESDGEATEKVPVIEDNVIEEGGNPLPQFNAGDDVDAGVDSRKARSRAMRVHRAMLGGGRIDRVWNRTIAFLDTVTLDAGGERGGGNKGEDVDGWINKAGLVQGALEPLRKFKFVAELGHGCGVSTMLLATRHIVSGFEIVRSRFEYSERLLSHIRRSAPKLNHVELGTIYCLFIRNHCPAHCLLSEF
jgi:hypothetical protein